MTDLPPGGGYRRETAVKTAYTHPLVGGVRKTMLSGVVPGEGVASD